jgi:GAF domain-containing protein
MAYVPIAWEGEVRYVAILISHEPRDFDADAIDFANTAANQAAAALALLESERRRALQVVAALLKRLRVPAFSPSASAASAS